VLSLFEDSRVAMWVVFSDVWNAVVEELRSIDLVSNGERDNLLFVHLDLDPSIEVGSLVFLGGGGGRVAGGRVCLFSCGAGLVFV
jgi:hypothetical protein